MKNVMKKIVFIFVLLSASAVGFFVWTNPSQANSVPHIIINEIQVAGVSSNDELIELFNPTNAAIDLEGYKLSKKTKTGSSESTLVSTTKFSGTIEAHGYFLIAHTSYKDEISADLSYSSSTYYISSDNTVFLYGKDGTLLDKVGFGAVDHSNSESSPALNPDTNQSIERTDFTDTNDNAADFSINTSPSPQNKSIIEDGGEESPGDGVFPEDTANINDTAPNTSTFCAATSSNIRLNEIFPYPESGNEFVEIINTGGSCVDISGWKIMDDAGHKKEFPENSTMGPGEYFFLEGNLYLNNDSDTIYLLGKDSSAKNDALDNIQYVNAQKNFSFSFDEQTWRWTSESTPESENIFDAPADNETISDINSGSVNISAAEKIYLNEILPHPKGDEKTGEFIEIVNQENEPVDLFGWTIRDGSKTGKYIFKEHVEIDFGEYLAIYRPESKLALNNSTESVTLFNPQGEITSNVSWDKTLEGSSYNYDDANWKWSKYLTPGKENKFDSPPVVKISKIKTAYKDLYTEFSVKAKDKETKKLKYTWDFGDGKQSYLAKTSHKYLDTGKYTVTLTVGDDSQTVEKSFVLAVKKYPRPNLEIIRIVPNPIGNDSDGEIVEIRNNSGKKIELQGWKIATGSGSKMNNHLINDGISLEPNETKMITREMCKFSLNNKTGKIQLVMPDGKVTDVVEYQKEKIADDEAYVRINNEWQWITPNSPTETGDSQETSTSEDTRDEGSDEQPDGEILGATDENVPYFTPTQSGYTSEDEFIFFKFFGLLEHKPREATFCPAIQPVNTLAYF